MTNKQLIAELKNRGFQLCELKPVKYPHYLDGEATEWVPLLDRRAALVVQYTIALLTQKDAMPSRTRRRKARLAKLRRHRK